jgi:hypothetical protein
MPSQASWHRFAGFLGGMYDYFDTDKGTHSLLG